MCGRRVPAGSGVDPIVEQLGGDRVMHVFEALLGLPERLLRPVPDTANRSLTLAET
jgi:hypothetical protein